MGIFDWLWGAKAQTVQEEEAPKRSAIEEALAKKYAVSFSKPKNAGTTEMVTMFSQCKEDLRYVRDQKLSTAINYYAIECLDAYISHLIDVSELAFKKRNFYMMFEVLKEGLSIINLNGLTMPEIEEKIAPIITRIVSTNIPEEIKLFKYIDEGRDFDIVLEQDISLDAIERILKFCKTYKEITAVMSKNTIFFTLGEVSLEEFELRESEIRTVFGNYLFRPSNITNFIDKVENSLEFLKKSMGSTIEIFRDDYLCHVVYARGPESVRSILNGGSLLITAGGLWFYINDVHSGGTTNPAFIFCLADILKEVKEKRLNFEISSEKGAIKFAFISKYNLFYDSKQSRYLTFKEIKDILKTGRYAAAIFPSGRDLKEKTQSFAVCILDLPVSFYATYGGKSTVSFTPQYAIYSIQKVDRGNEDPRKQMFNSVYDASLYLMNTNEGRQILKNLLYSYKR